jgi:hypothetical protein
MTTTEIAFWRDVQSMMSCTKRSFFEVLKIATSKQLEELAE